MWKKAIKILFVELLLCLFFIVSAQADTHPVVSGLQDIWRREKIVNSKGADASNGYWGVDLTCVQSPSLGGTGRWTIGLDTSHGSVTSTKCWLMMKDYSSDYSTVYAKDVSGAVSSFTSCRIVSGGNYCLAIWVDFSDGYEGYGQYEFTISDDSSHISLDEKITQVVNNCRASTQWQTALNLYDWLTHNIYYDLNYEYYGADAILRGYGVCDSYSKAYMMLCKKAGIPVGRVTNSNHAWNAIQLGGNWYYVDATWDDPAGAKTAISGDENHWYFCITQKILFLDHPTASFKQDSNIGGCTSLDMNYFIKTNEWTNWGTDFNSTEVLNRFPDVIQNTLNTGNPVYVLPDNEKIYYKAQNGLIYYAGESARAILSYALTNTHLSIANGGAIRVQVTESPLTVKLLGWNITETGTITIPDKTEIIPVNGFANTRATTVVIPSKCKTINSKAFYGSYVRTVKIPDSVTSIAADAFNNCERIIFRTNNAVAKQYASAHGIIVLAP